eukprot:699098-Rhodomonas_salina.1
MRYPPTPFPHMLCCVWTPQPYPELTKQRARVTVCVLMSVCLSVGIAVCLLDASDLDAELAGQRGGVYDAHQRGDCDVQPEDY